MFYLQGPDGSNSCCVVQVQGTSLHLEYGQRGGSLKLRTTQFPTFEKAQQRQYQAISRLLSKGYRLGRRDAAAVADCARSATGPTQDAPELFRKYGQSLVEGSNGAAEFLS